jgi:aryl-alcohol dehydrogenase-like predicted oxidoreductase
MQHRTLGSTGLSVGVVGLGTWQLGGEWGRDYSQSEADAIVDAARESGINLIDTAECYGDHESERLVGGAIERDRDHWVVCTKFGHKYHGFMDRTEPREPSDVRRQLEDSLSALRTDRVEVLQYHSWGDEQFFRDDVLAECQKLKDEGKLLHLGNSIGSNQNLKQTAASGGRGVEVIQLIYNRLDRAPEADVLPSCRTQNLGVLARVPLASGYLTGKYRPGDTFETKNDVRTRHDPAARDEKLAEVARIQRDEVPPGTDMATWALAWCLRHEAVTCVIPGCKTPAQVRTNAAAAELVEQW